MVPLFLCPVCLEPFPKEVQYIIPFFPLHNSCTIGKDIQTLVCTKDSKCSNVCPHMTTVWEGEEEVTLMMLILSGYLLSLLLPLLSSLFHHPLTIPPLPPLPPSSPPTTLLTYGTAPDRHEL